MNPENDLNRTRNSWNPGLVHPMFFQGATMREVRGEHALVGLGCSALPKPQAPRPQTLQPRPIPRPWTCLVEILRSLSQPLYKNLTWFRPRLKVLFWRVLLRLNESSAYASLDECERIQPRFTTPLADRAMHKPGGRFVLIWLSCQHA